jgi:hypothetical protein
MAVNVSTGSLRDVKCEGGVPLAARAATSFPPFAAVCLYGDDRVAEWLRAQGLERWQYEDVLPATIAGFEDAWRERCPLFGDSSIIAQIGGWHIRWSDDEFL